jgi:hypothetical protein
MALGLPNGIPFCWQPPVKTASDIESSPNLRISADGGVSEFSNGCLDGRAFSLVQASPVGVLPSLLIVPQSYKSGKLYAQLPNARVNHIPNNSMFGASGGVLPSGWTFSVGAASGVSLGYSASGQVTAEDGTLVDYIDFTFSGTATASGFLNLRPNASPSTISSVSGQSWNASVYFQLISGSVASISPTYQLQETTSGGTFINGSNITGLGSLTTSLPLRRYNVTRDLDTSGTVVTCRWGHSIATGTTYNYTLRIGSPQLENLSSPTSVIRTVSGAVYAPYSGENVRTNLALQSENFTTTWFGIGLNAFGSGSVANSTGTTDPFGGTNADYIQENSASGTHLILQINAGQVSGTNLTFSVFAKAAERTQINLLNNGGGGGSATFNLTAGTATLISGVSASIQNYGNGWYRCIFTYTPNATGNFNVQVRLVDASGNTSYTGTGTSGLYVFGAQLETGSSATPYIRTTTAPNSFPIASIADFTVSRNTTATRVNSSGLIESVASGVPRIDWLGQSCPALLVEASASNGILNSTDTTTNWTCWSGFTSGVIDVLGVSGVNLQVNTSGSNIGAGTGNGNIARTGNNVALASGSTYTLSFFIKKTGAHTIGGYYASITGAASGDLGGGFNVSGSFSSGSIYNTAGTTNRIRRVEQWGTDVYRCSETFTMTASGTLTTFRLAPVSGVTLASLSAVGTELGFAAPQIELSSVPTTFIPTTTGQATRNADVVSVSGVSGYIGQTEGTIYAEVDLKNFEQNARIIALSDGTTSNRITLIFNTASRFRLLVNVSTSGQVDLSSSAQVSGIYKVAVAYKENDYAFYLNGTQIGTDTSALVPACTSVFLGKIESSASTNFLNDRIRAAALYTTRLSNDQLAELTRL